MIIGARYVIPTAGELIKNGGVYLSEGRVVAVGKTDELVKSYPYANKVDLGNCLITPGLVNFHCHIELEFCRGKVSYEGNFIEWLQRIRDLKHDFLTLPGYFPERSVRETISSGVTTLVDHYTMQLDFEAIFDSGLRYFGLRELFDFNSHNPNLERLRESTIYSFAPHSPYTTSPEMVKAAYKLAETMNRPVSTHLSEMSQEIEFLQSGNMDIERLLRRAGAYEDSWCAPGVSPVRYFYDLGVLSPRTYCVHLNYALPGDIELLARCGITHIYCPRSHAYFCHPKHPLMEYQRAGITSCLGTDSYGSNADLRILGEAEKMCQEFPELPLVKVFQMMTTSGLGPLGMNGLLGELIPGAFADIAAWNDPEGDTFEEVLRWLLGQKTTVLTMREARIIYER